MRNARPEKNEALVEATLVSNLLEEVAAMDPTQGFAHTADAIDATATRSPPQLQKPCWGAPTLVFE
jgi:hypothetical protein